MNVHVKGTVSNRSIYIHSTQLYKYEYCVYFGECDTKCKRTASG